MININTYEILLLFIVIFIIGDVMIRMIYNYYETKNNKMETFRDNIESKTDTSNLPSSIIDIYKYVDSRDGEDYPLILRNRYELPILNFSLFDSNSYDKNIYEYMRHHIYPVKLVPTISNIQTIYQMQNGICDIAFISEEILMRYMTKSCRILNKIIENEYSNLGQNKLEAIGVGYYEYMYFIIRNSDNIHNIEQVLNIKIGICKDDYYYFRKMLAMKNIDITKLNLYITDHLDNIINEFKHDLIKCIFIVTHPKNNDLINLSQTINLKFIPIFNTDETIQNMEINKYKQYFATGIYSVEDLNHFYKYGNIFKNSTYNTIGIRTILTINPQNKNYNLTNKNNYNRHKIIYKLTSEMKSPKSLYIIEYLCMNYINNLTKLRFAIDMANFRQKLNNFDAKDFNHEEMVSMHPLIPLNDICKNIYIEEGLIELKSKIECSY